MAKKVKLIDASKLLGIFCTDCGMRDGSCSNSCEKDCAIYDTITSAPTIESEPVDDWISVDDRLPEKSGRYLVYTSCIANYRPLKDNVFVAGFVNRDWVFEGWESNLVTHWRSLPKPPKGE